MLGDYFISIFFTTNKLKKIELLYSITTRGTMPIMNLQFLPNEIITIIQDFVYPKINKIPKDDTRYAMLTMLLASDREIICVVSGFGPGYKRYTRFIAQDVTEDWLYIYHKRIR